MLCPRDIDTELVTYVSMAPAYPAASPPATLHQTEDVRRKLRPKRDETAVETSSTSGQKCRHEGLGETSRYRLFLLMVRRRGAVHWL